MDQDLSSSSEDEMPTLPIQNSVLHQSHESVTSIAQDFAGAFGMVQLSSNDQDTEHGNDNTREFINDDEARRIWNLPVNFGTGQDCDFEYDTKEAILKNVIHRVGLDVDSIYGTSSSLASFIKVINVERLEMPKDISTKPMTSSRIALRITHGVRRKTKTVNLSRFQNLLLAKLHCRGITFHTSAVLVDPDSCSNKKSIPMKIENSLIISIAMNAARLLVLEVIEVKDLISSACTPQALEIGQIILKGIDNIIVQVKEINAFKTQHWLGINNAFGHHCPSGATNQVETFMCNQSDGLIFTNIMDLVIKLMACEILTPDAPLFKERYNMIFSETTILNENRKNTVVNMMDCRSKLLQKAASYVSQHLIYHASCAGIKNVLSQERFAIKDDEMTNNQVCFDMCRGKLLKTVDLILNRKEMLTCRDCVMYGDLGFTFQHKEHYKNCLATPLSVKSAYGKIDISAMQDNFEDIMLSNVAERIHTTDQSDPEEVESDHVDDDDDDEDSEDEKDDEDYYSCCDEPEDDLSIESANDDLSDIPQHLNQMNHLRFKEEYELFFNSKMAGRRTGSVLCDYNSNHSAKIPPHKVNISSMLHGAAMYVSGSRESKNYKRDHIDLLQELPTIARGMCINSGRCLTCDESKMFDNIIHIIRDMKTFENVLELGNPYNLKLRLEYFFCIAVDENETYDDSTFSINMTQVLETKIALAPKPLVAQNYYRTIEKARQIVLNTLLENGRESLNEFKPSLTSNMKTTLILACELLAYAPGTSTGPQIPYPIMRLLKKELILSEKLHVFYFPEYLIDGITFPIEDDFMQGGPRYGITAKFNKLPEQAIDIVNAILTDVFLKDQSSINSNQNFYWKSGVEKLIRELQCKNFGGHYMKLSAKKYHTMRRVAFKETCDTMFDQTVQIIGSKSDTNEKIECAKGLVLMLSRVFWLAYLLQVKDDIFKLKLVELVEDGEVPIYEKSLSQMQRCGYICNIGECKWSKSDYSWVLN